MNNEVKDRDIENHTCYFFNDIFKVRHFDSSNIKRDEKSFKNILICYIGYVLIKDSNCVKFYSINPLDLSFLQSKWILSRN